MNNIAKPFYTLFYLLLLSGYSSSGFAFQALILPSGNNISEQIQLPIELAITKSLQGAGFQSYQNQAKMVCDNQCMQNDPALFEQSRTMFPEIDILVFYGIENTHSATLTAVHPENMQALARTELTYNRDENIILSDVFADAALLLIDRLSELKLTTKLLLHMNGFTVNELVPISSFLISISVNNEIELIETKRVNSLFSGSFPIVESTFSLTTDIPVNHLINELKRYWDLQDIKIGIQFSLESSQLTVNRHGKPYTPSIVSFIIFFIFLIILTMLALRRFETNRTLEYLSKNKQADEWLKLYEHANKPWIKLNKKWQNQLSYWRQIKRESEGLEQQAKLYFDAGDFNTSKLFVSKALNINACAPLAQKLIIKIKEDEEGIEQLNENEQWIRNKIAKAMINYRNNNIYKALRQAYQAELKCGKQKPLKKQLKGINKLLNKILYQEALRVDRVQLRLLGSVGELSIGCEESVFIGREDNWFAQKGIGIMEFSHKGLSRIGRHAKCSLNEQGLNIIDLGSANGTYINNQKINQTYSLAQGDQISLASNSKQKGVFQNIHYLQYPSAVCFETANQIEHDMSIADLAGIWSDYIKATNRLFVVTKVMLNIGIDTYKNRLIAAYANEQNQHFKVIFKIGLEPFLFVEPATDITVKVDNETLLGRVPLKLPVEISFEDKILSITKSEYAWTEQYTTIPSAPI